MNNPLAGTDPSGYTSCSGDDKRKCTKEIEVDGETVIVTATAIANEDGSHTVEVIYTGGSNGAQNAAADLVDKALQEDGFDSIEHIGTQPTFVGTTGQYGDSDRSAACDVIVGVAEQTVADTVNGIVDTPIDELLPAATIGRFIDFPTISGLIGRNLSISLAEPESNEQNLGRDLSPAAGIIVAFATRGKVGARESVSKSVQEAGEDLAKTANRKP